MRIVLVWGLFLAGCGGPESGELVVSVSGVGMAELETVRADLERLKGVSAVRPGALKDGRAEIRVRYAGDGAALAADLARLGSGLRNVTGFDAGSVQVAWGGPAAPAPAAEPGAAAPAGKPDEKREIRVDVKKDPLAYKVHKLEGGTIATFDGWAVNQLPNDELIILETHPQGRENDFQMVILVGVQNEQDQSRLFEEGPEKLRELFPGLREAGEARKALFGGDEGRLQDWTIEVQGRPMLVQTVLIRKKDVAVGILAVGTEATFREYGRALTITAQSLTVKESPPDPGLLGTWHLEKYYSSGAGSNAFSHSSSRSITVYPNGTFTERSFSSSSLGGGGGGSTSAYLDGGDRGKVLRRGTLLTFHYDNGKTWTAEYKLEGGALRLGGNLWMRQ